jgi:N-acyl-D-amino-acid deacylase
MPDYDILIRGGTIYDGGGSAPFHGDVAIYGGQIAAVGDLKDASAAQIINADGLAVAPGFINMLSWSTESLIEDGRSQSEIRQGVTLEVMGEGSSMGPLNEMMKDTSPGGFMRQGDIRYDIEWTTLGEYLDYLERRGVAPNIASFVGYGTLRVYAVGYDDRRPTPAEREQMKTLLRQAMEEGAVGLSTALIYPPEFYSTTEELVELARVVAEYDGLYISHLRSEGSAFLEALDEFFTIVRQAGVRGEIYHLKAAGRSNWHKMETAIARIEAARAEGLPITADMYTYPFSGTGLDASLPPWAHEGGHNALVERLKDPDTRARIRAEIVQPADQWENMYAENWADRIMVAGFKTERLKPLTGKTLAEVAADRGASPEDTLMDLIVEDNSRVFTMYFSMSEDNLRRQAVLPWVSFCSDAGSQAPEGVFLKSNPHPRAYGSFARVLAKYVRDERIIPLEEAVRRLTSFPAANLKIEGRGWLRPGYAADVAIFDPDNVQDHATPQQPHWYSTGMVYVLVNGVPVLHDGEHTGATPGRVVRGPGWKRNANA